MEKNEIMNIAKLKNLSIMSLVVMGLLIGSCEEMLDIDSTRVVGEQNMWNSLEDTRAALMGTYGLTRAALADNNAFWLYGDVRLGPFRSPVRQDLKAIIGNNLDASYPVVESLSNWRRWYAVINSANLFLERADEVVSKDSRYTESNMLLDMAQVRFLRAFAYFYMTRIWGDVPLITSSRDGDFEDRARTDQEIVLDFVEQEMEAVADALPFKYSANDPQQPGLYYNETESRLAGSLVRKLTAYAVLTHVAAWRGNYANSAVYSKYVMDNYSRGGNGFLGIEELTASDGFFSSRSYNQLLGFSFDFQTQEAGFTGHIEELTLAQPVVNKKFPDIYVPTETILSIFNEKDDSRFSIDTVGVPNSERYFTNFNGKYPIFNKIKVIQGGGNDPSFRIFSSGIVFTRLEDIVLLRAEALAVLQDEENATEHLNIIREMRDLEPYDEGKNGSLIDAIFQERQRELIGEGHYWYDLVRYNKIKRNDTFFRQLIESGGIYWPISQELLSQNNQLTQNPYWQ